MSQQATAPAPAAAPAAPPQPGQQPVPAGQAGTTVEDTPKLLNRWQLVGVTAVLLFGVASALVQFISWQADGRAADDTEQLLRIQEIQSSILRADALATNEFLVGGEGDSERRAEYDMTIDHVLEEIAAAADAQPADEAALQSLVVTVDDYTTAVTEARVNNRQQLALGSAYLSEASAGLRNDARPILDNLVEANTERAESSMAGQHPFWLLLIGLVALAVLVWLNILLAQRFRRYVNVGLAVGAVIIVVTTLVAVVAAWRGDDQNDGLLENELQTAVDQAAARTAGNDAKAYESLRLINQGSAGTNEPLWEEAADIVEDRADATEVDEDGATVLDHWNAYAEGHREIAELDDRDRWFAAKAVAIDSDDEAPTELFDRFDTASQTLADENGQATTDALRAGRTPALVGSLLTLLLGFVASIAVARGIGARRREYA